MGVLLGFEFGFGLSWGRVRVGFGSNEAKQKSIIISPTSDPNSTLFHPNSTCVKLFKGIVSSIINHKLVYRHLYTIKRTRESMIPI